MSCNGCAHKFTFLRREKGCPSCGFSYCSKCLKSKLFLEKLNAEVKVCPRCKISAESNAELKVAAPDAYYKRTGAHPVNTASSSTNPQDDEIQTRLKKLKEDALEKITPPTVEEISQRLKMIRDVPATSESELRERLAKLKDMPNISANQPNQIPEQRRSSEEEVDELMRQFMEQSKIDACYEDKLNQVLHDIHNRLQKLKDQDKVEQKNDMVEQPKGVISKVNYLRELHTELDETDNLMRQFMEQSKKDAEYDDKLVEVLESIQKRIKSMKSEENKGDKEGHDDEKEIKEIVEKYSNETILEESENNPAAADQAELPFCEICNEDATLRCLGCRYLFCKECSHEHKDDDDGCNVFEVYKAINKI